MRSVQHLQTGHYVDEVGHVIICTYVDFRDPTDRCPITSLSKASSKPHAIPGARTVRLSKPCRFVAHGEGPLGCLEQRPEPANTAGGMRTSGRAVNTSAPVPPAGDAMKLDDECLYARNVWIYCTFMEAENPSMRAAWREAMPRKYAAVSTIREPREFARALGAMAAQQVGPHGRVVVMRRTVESEAPLTVHRSQVVYHGPVIYSRTPRQRLDRASSVREFALLLVFMKHAQYRAQREYRFAVWAEDEPRQDWVELEVSAALLKAVQKQRQEPDRKVVLSAGATGSPARREAQEYAAFKARAEIEARPGRTTRTTPTSAAQRFDLRPFTGLTSELSVPCATPYELHPTVAGCRESIAAAYWHAEPIMDFLCSTFGDGTAGVRVTEDSFIVVTVEIPEDDEFELEIAIGPDGTCACRLSRGGRHIASVAPDAWTFMLMLRDRLADIGQDGLSSDTRVR